jgi:hypothetical protein
MVNAFELPEAPVKIISYALVSGDPKMMVGGVPADAPVAPPAVNSGFVISLPRASAIFNSDPLMTETVMLDVFPSAALSLVCNADARPSRSVVCRFKLLIFRMVVSRLIENPVKSVSAGGVPKEGLANKAVEGTAAVVDLTSCALTGNGGLVALMALTTPEGVALSDVIGIGVVIPPTDNERLNATPLFIGSEVDTKDVLAVL